MGKVVQLAPYLQEKNSKSYKEKLLGCIFSKVPFNSSNVFGISNPKEDQEKLLNIFKEII